MKHTHTILAASILFAVPFMLDADGKAAGGTSEPPSDRQREAQRRRQAEAAARNLREKAEDRAAAESNRTGTQVEPEQTPTADELFDAASKGGDGGGTFTEKFLSGPEPQPARPGETVRRAPATILATARVPLDVINAPGLGADTGIKKSPDNIDARGGPAHAEGADPADNISTAENPNAFTGIPGVHAKERHDTAGAQREMREKLTEGAAKLVDGPAADQQVEIQQALARTGAGASEHSETAAPTDQSGSEKAPTPQETGEQTLRENQ